MAFEISSPAFDNGGVIPGKHVKEHGNVSPALDWRGAPEGTESYALIVEDPDAPNGTFRHWAVCDIPVQQLGLEEGQDLGEFTVCTNDFGDRAYDGPRPPAGHGPHHYHFKLAALDVELLDVRADADALAMWKAAEGHIVAEAEIIGMYESQGE